MPLKRPLNPDAVKAADAKLAEKTGGRKLGMGPEDKSLREEWMEEYRNAAGEDAPDEAPPPANIKCTTLPCGLKIYGFVGRYTYVDRTGVAGAQYVIKDMGDKELAKGVTDGEGRFKQEELTTPYVYFQVSKDPNPKEYFPQPTVENIPPAEGHEAFTSAVAWLKGFFQGDFNEDQSMSQILVTAAVGMIPIVGQVMAGRDLIANLLKLVHYYEGKAQRSQDQIAKDNAEFFGLGREFMLWLLIVLNAIQAFPTLGAAASGIIRVLFKELGAAAKAATPQRLKVIFEAVAEVLNKFGKFNAKEWLKEFKGKLPEIMQFAKGKLTKVIAALEEGVAKLKGELSKIPGWFPGSKKAEAAMEELKKLEPVINDLKKGLEENIKKIEEEVGKKVDGVLENTEHAAGGGAADMEQKKLAQKAKEPPPLEEAAEAGKLKFGEDDLVYGPSAGGKLRELQKQAGGKLLNDLPKPDGVSFVDFTKETLKDAAESGRKVHFDMSNMKNVDEALEGTGKYGDAVTSHELRYMRDNWDKFKTKPSFYQNGVEVPPPWL